MDLLDDSDEYGLTNIVGDKIEIYKSPLQLKIDNKIYKIDLPEYIEDINIDLYQYLINERNNNNTLKIRLYKQMIKENVEYNFIKYNGKSINLQELKKELKNFKSISYNPNNNDKFIASIDVEKQFIHIYEFVSNSLNYKAKYIHAQ